MIAVVEVASANRVKRDQVIGPAREVHLHLNVSPDQLSAIVEHYTREN